MNENEKLERAIAALEAQRAILGEGVVDAALVPLRERIAALQAQHTGQQRKQVTVLFADMSGFTVLAETTDAEEVGDMLNALWQPLDAAAVFRQLAEADIVVYATPVYVFGLSGLLKTFLERFYGRGDGGELSISKSGPLFHHMDRAICSKPFVTLVYCDNLEVTR